MVGPLVMLKKNWWTGFRYFQIPKFHTHKVLLSNSSNWHVMDKLWSLPLFSISYIASVPLLTSSFLALLRDRPFILQEGLGVMEKKSIFWFPMLLKKIFWFWWRKKKSDSEFLSYNLMLNSEKKINILTQVLSENYRISNVSFQ
jgi:hypothetical protein